MIAAVSDDPDDQDWRLRFELGQGHKHALNQLIRSLRDTDGGAPGAATVPHDVVITHDGQLLYAYAAQAQQLEQARRAIEERLRHEGIEASATVSHWENDLDTWRQTDPPPSEEESRREAAVERDAETVETRTLVAVAGKLVRASLEQSLLEWAHEHQVQCEIVEHPHLLSTQVAFTITGPRHQLDEFAAVLRQEGTATIRAERGVMFSPI